MNTHSTFSPLDRAKLHPIRHNSPAISFFQGALLGNGGLGAVICSRPDAVMIRFAHNSVWDIRICEDHRENLSTFSEVFERIRNLPESLAILEEDPWYAEYQAQMQSSYGKPYPRPFPCGTLLLGFDPRGTELIGHELDISNGECRIEFLIGTDKAVLSVFVDQYQDRLWLSMRDAVGEPCPGPFNRIRLIPDPSTPAEFPTREVMEDANGGFGFRQVLPATELEKSLYEKHPDDRAFQLHVTCTMSREKRDRLGWEGVRRSMAELEFSLIPNNEHFIACADFKHGLASELEKPSSLPSPEVTQLNASRVASDKCWSEYWSRSGVALADKELERTWYHNTFFLHCVLRAGQTCPGLFANWSYKQIGTAWHGDYHMNYNTQQPFWGVFSSNHADLHMPYVDLVAWLMPVSQVHARDYYKMRGAFFPHSAYPVKMTVLPYAGTTWAWEIFETPWTVQSLWWHYRYTHDVDFLRTRGFGPMREAVLFLVDYLSRPDAHGPQWGDDLYHIFPAVDPELHGALRPEFDKNRDLLVDIVFSRFVFRAFLDACIVLEHDEPDLVATVARIVEKLPELPTAETPFGRILVSSEGSDDELVYNTPNNLMSAFPCEEHGLGSDPEMLALLQRTYRSHRNEGGNDLVFLNLQAARIGMLDLEKFKRHIRYCLLPNGTCADLDWQVGGRYSDDTEFDFMAGMGIWIENFSLPAVINECLFQGYDGTLRFFPNWPDSAGDAEFLTLRSVGAFLVSARIEAGRVRWIKVLSEKGNPLRIQSPWKETKVQRSRVEETYENRLIDLNTQVGELIRLTQGQILL